MHKISFGTTSIFTNALVWSTKKPNGTLTVCEYIDHLVNVCGEKYQNVSPAEKKAIMSMWLKQEIYHTTIYGPPGAIATCEGSRKTLSDEVLKLITTEFAKYEYWWTEPKYCNFYYEYNSGNVYNNLEAILRCDAKCDPNQELDKSFETAFITEKMWSENKEVVQKDRTNPEYVNSAMNDTYNNYFGCMRKIGWHGNTDLRDNLTSANSYTYKTAKWTTCASFATYIRECIPTLLTCLSRESAEHVIAEDAYIMTLAVHDGINQAYRKDLLEDFDYTDCTIFGGNQSGAVGVHNSVASLIITIFLCWTSKALM